MITPRTERLLWFAAERQRKLARRRAIKSEAEAVALKQEVNSQRARAYRAESVVHAAREDGANAVLQAEYLPLLVKEIGERLARAYGEEILPVAAQLQAGRERWDRPIDLDARFVDCARGSFLTIRGEIKAIRYCVMVV